MHQRLDIETLHRTVDIVDRYSDSTPHLPKEDYQVVGCAALLIASKVEDYMPPSRQWLVKISSNAFDIKRLAMAEIEMLGILDYNTTNPTTITFLQHYLTIDKHNTLIGADNVAKYVLELTLMELNYLRYSPSLIAAAALYLGNKIQAIKQHVNYTLSQVISTAHGFRERNLKVVA
jgi:hypothetical protein